MRPSAGSPKKPLLPRFGMTAKLFLLNLVSFLVFGAIAGVMFWTFAAIMEQTTAVIERDVPKVIGTSRLGRDLSEVFSGTHLLASTFYGNHAVLRREEVRLKKTMDRLLTQEEGEGIHAALSDFGAELDHLFARCRAINGTADRIHAIDAALRGNIDGTEALLLEKKIARVTDPSAAAVFDQMSAMMSVHRETLLEISLRFARLNPAVPGAMASGEILSGLKRLRLQAETLLASEMEIRARIEALLDGISAYRRRVVEFQAALIGFRDRLGALEAAKGRIETAMARVDQNVVDATQRMVARHRETLGGALGFVLLVSLAVIGLLGISTYLFFNLNIRGPMEAIGNALRNVGDGDFDTRITLNRTDEWSALEAALNEMVSEVWHSYSELYRKNEALHRAQLALRSNMARLEEEVGHRRQAEQELKQERDLMELIMRTSPVGIMAVGRRGEISFANPRSVELLDLHAGETGSDPPASAAGTPPTPIPPIRTALESGTAVMEAQMAVEPGGDRETRQVSVNAAPFFDGEGRVEGVVATIEDISRRIRAEAEKDQLYKQLLQAQKMEAVGTLAGGIAHDFNNLLQGIQGYAELLRMTPSLAEPAGAKLNAIQQAVERGSDLVRRLLTFARKVEGTPRPLDLNREIRHIQKLLERTIPKMVEIEVRAGEDLWTVMADPMQMEQVLLNLAVNANDAMPDGGSIVIRTENIDLDQAHCNGHPDAIPGPHVLLTLSDTGHGMSPATLENIFTPFFTTKEVGRGTGLGLAMVFGIVKDHGGHLTCASEPGRGTVFRLYLPAVPTRDAPAPLPKPASLRGAETVLVVDDEAVILDFASQVLSDFGYTPMTAASGEEALALYQGSRGTIDLVILDLNMPGMGGWRCLKRLLEVDPGVKVLLASGFPEDAGGRRVETERAKGFLSKPYRLAQLIETIRRVLDADAPETDAGSAE